MTGKRSGRSAVLPLLPPVEPHPHKDAPQPAGPLRGILNGIHRRGKSPAAGSRLLVRILGQWYFHLVVQRFRRRPGLETLVINPPIHTGHHTGRIPYIAGSLSRARLICECRGNVCDDMKVFIQQPKTGHFLRVDSFWTKDICDAFDFPSTTRAISFGLNLVKESFRVVEVQDGDSSRTPAPLWYRFSHEHVCPIELQTSGSSRISPNVLYTDISSAL